MSSLVLREGQRVAYVGDGEHGLLPGDRGKVLSSSGYEVHVVWATGAKSGQITLHGTYDLVPEGGQSVQEDRHIVAVAVRKTYDRLGTEAVSGMLGEEGILVPFIPLVDDAVSIVVSALRSDPIMQQALSFLEPDEADDVLVTATLTLIQEAFGAEEVS